MDIQEIPLTEETTEGTQESSEVLEDVPVVKKRGRLPGAKNRASASSVQETPKVVKVKEAPKAVRVSEAPPKAKPRAKRKAPVYEESSDSEEQERRPRYAEEYMDDRAAETQRIAANVLGLLQQQRVSQSQARRNHYASFFQNL